MRVPKSPLRFPLYSADVLHGLAEAVHLEKPLDGDTRTIQCQRTIGLASDRDESSVDCRCTGSVQAQFILTTRAPPFGGREVEVVETSRALQLIGPRSGQKQNRRMRVDAIYRESAMRAR